MLLCSSRMSNESSRLMVLSNRGPQRWSGGAWSKPSGGLVTALDPVLRERGGVWVSSAEVEGAPDPPASLGYDQVLVRVPEQVHENFYAGFANGVLWPAMHGFPTIAEMNDAPFEDYRTVNRAFADAALGCGQHDVIWAHDYHLMMLPAMIREARPAARIGWFNHIPWPDFDHFAVLPWRREILQGLLGADVLGFHTARYASHFFECAESLAEADVDREHGIVRTERGSTRVVVSPIGIPVDKVVELANSESVRERESKLRRAVGGRRIVLGVDRLDYTKGVPERLAAFERFLEKNPDAVSDVVLTQIVVPSREDVPAYEKLKMEIERLVGRLNGRFGGTGCAPVHYLYRSVDQVELYAHYRAADVALVTPLRDGMNMVALEYVAARTEHTGALVLSEFAGAAERLSEAYVVNPHDVDMVAAQIGCALFAPSSEQQRRMSALRRAVQSLDLARWAEAFLDKQMETQNVRARASS